MGPLSQHDRSAVELTARLLLAEARRLRAAINASREPRKVLRAALNCETGARVCAALLAPKAPPDPGVAAPEPHP